MSEEAKEESMASMGGKARSAKMTPDERKQSAKKAAEARWAAKLPVAPHTGVLNLAGFQVECAVLEDGRRLISQQSFIEAIGRKGNLKTSSRSEDGVFFETPVFLAADNLKPYVDKHLTQASRKPILFRDQSGRRAYGYEANLLPIACRIYLDARRDKKLHHNQKHIAETCEILQGALASVGIDALVDEATGFQFSRGRDALQKLLEQYVSKELARWERTFEADFYRHMFRLQGWPYNPNSTKRSHHVARLTVDLTYQRIHPDLLDELKKVRGDGSKPSSKLHQWLTNGPTGGHPRLKQHLEGIVALMSVAENWGQFMDWVERRYPKPNQTLRIPLFNEDDDQSADTN